MLNFSNGNLGEFVLPSSCFVPNSPQLSLLNVFATNCPPSLIFVSDFLGSVRAQQSWIRCHLHLQLLEVCCYFNFFICNSIAICVPLLQPLNGRVTCVNQFGRPIIEDHRYSVGDVCTFRCNLGYFPMGTSIRRCQENGWSGTDFTCEGGTYSNTVASNNAVVPMN